MIRRKYIYILASFQLGFSTCIFLVSFGSLTQFQFNLDVGNEHPPLSVVNKDCNYTEPMMEDLLRHENHISTRSRKGIQNQHNETENSNHFDVLHELDVLSGGYGNNETLDCPHPLVPFYNRIIREHKGESKPLIPKILHVSMKSRCLPRDYAMHMDRWAKKFPNYSIFLSDDDSVARFIEQEWPEFPDIHDAMKCVLYKGAMTIDVWRVLMLYKYGGVYTDIDNWPLDRFNEEKIRSDVSAFFFTDAYNRPSQWFFAVEPHHPMMYLSMRQIIQNILNMTDIRRPKVVRITGPQAFNQGYFYFLAPKCCNGTTDQERLFRNDVILKGILDKTVLKTNGERFIVSKPFFDEMVPYNSTLNVTRRE